MWIHGATVDEAGFKAIGNGIEGTEISLPPIFTVCMHTQVQFCILHE